jgi:basic amino acid/polyamine antiporter, APA family
LAAYGSISFFGWLISSAGAFFLALVFSDLSKTMPMENGGPYIYSREGLGHFAGFLVAWGYWISVWVTNAAIAAGFVGYLTVFIPSIGLSPFSSALTGLTAIWFLTWINSKGIAKAGKLQLVTSILKLTPLILVSVGGLFFLNFSHFVPMNLSGETTLSAIASTTAITLFAFVGVESATINSATIKNPEVTVPRATKIGTLIAILVYMLGSMSVMGIIPPETLANSTAPFSDAAALMWGESARYFVAGGAVISTFGALNGWILIQGQIPAAIARDKLFPTVFAIENKYGAPVFGIVIGSILSSALIFMNYSKGMVSAFTFFILLSTLCTLIPYLFSSASYFLIHSSKKTGKPLSKGKIIIAGTAFLYSLWAVIGSGQEPVYWGFVLLMAGIPFYIWMKSSKTQSETQRDG